MRITESQLRRIIRQELMVEFAPSTGKTYDMNKTIPDNIINIINIGKLKSSVGDVNDKIKKIEKIEDFVRELGLDPKLINSYADDAKEKFPHVQTSGLKRYYNLINEDNPHEVSGWGAGGGFAGFMIGRLADNFGAFGGLDLVKFAENLPTNLTTRLTEILGSDAVNQDVIKDAIKQALQKPDIPPGVLACMVIGTVLGALFAVGR